MQLVSVAERLLFRDFLFFVVAESVAVGAGVIAIIVAEIVAVVVTDVAATTFVDPSQDEAP